MAADTFVDIEPASDDPDAIVRAYRTALEDEIDRTADDAIRAATDRPVEDLRGELGDLELTDVAAVLAAGSDARPDAMRDELLDQLLIAMTTAVIDVDALAGRVPLDLTGKEIQQRIEGRAPMTLREYALIRHTIGAD